MKMRFYLAAYRLRHKELEVVFSRDLARRVPGELTRERVEIRDRTIGPENDNHTLGRLDEILKDCFTLVSFQRRTVIAAGSRRPGCSLVLALLRHGHLPGLVHVQPQRKHPEFIIEYTRCGVRVVAVQRNGGPRACRAGTLRGIRQRKGCLQSQEVGGVRDLTGERESVYWNLRY